MKRTLRKLPQLREMVDVERLKSNTLQVEALRLVTENLQLSQTWDRSKEVAQLQARCNEEWMSVEEISVDLLPQVAEVRVLMTPL